MSVFLHFEALLLENNLENANNLIVLLIRRFRMYPVCHESVIKFCMYDCIVTPQKLHVNKLFVLRIKKSEYCFFAQNKNM